MDAAQSTINPELGIAIGAERSLPNETTGIRKGDLLPKAIFKGAAELIVACPLDNLWGHREIHLLLV